MGRENIEYISDVQNQEFRDKWVADTLRTLVKHFPDAKPGLIDVGAGGSPYRGIAEGIGFAYSSHDFNSYVPSNENFGLQNQSWDYAEHDFVCDIAELPDEPIADVVLCTEVLEHVPDPVRALEKMTHLLNPGGFLVVTVPFLSLMHQAPFWFQSGLSPFWFEYWAEKYDLEILSLQVQGDFADLLSQELTRYHLAKSAKAVFPLYRKGRAWLSRASTSRLRVGISDDILESGAFGTLFVGRVRA